MTVITKEEVLAVNLEEEASVLEILNQLVRRISTEDADALKAWLKSQLADAAREERIGFYVDEFGARDVREIAAEEAVALLDEPQTWSMESETMLHAFLLEE